jgi:hypothetical protein
MELSAARLLSGWIVSSRTKRDAIDWLVWIGAGAVVVAFAWPATLLGILVVNFGPRILLLPW